MTCKDFVADETKDFGGIGFQIAACKEHGGGFGPTAGDLVVEAGLDEMAKQVAL